MFEYRCPECKSEKTSRYRPAQLPLCPHCKTVMERIYTAPFLSPKAIPTRRMK